MVRHQLYKFSKSNNLVGRTFLHNGRKCQAVILSPVSMYIYMHMPPILYMYVIEFTFTNNGVDILSCTTVCTHMQYTFSVLWPSSDSRTQLYITLCVIAIQLLPNDLYWKFLVQCVCCLLF